MALETVVFPQDLFSYGCKELYTLGGGWSYDFGVAEEVEEEKVGLDEVVLDKNIDQCFCGNWDSSTSSMVQNVKDWDTNSSPEACTGDGFFACDFVPVKSPSPSIMPSRRKRRRTRSCKNKEEVENQRMTHIAVERNRRKQMNEYLAMLRSLMPSSYVQRGDQASIIGGAINCVKELEQLLQSLEAEKRIKQQSDPSFSSPFADFFTFPQYSSISAPCNHSGASNESVAENKSAIADIEVTMVESHANLKVLSRRRPKQLLKMVTGFQPLRLTVLHLNVTAVDQMALYSFSLKVEEECQLTSVDEIATAVHQMLCKIQEESVLS
ncbi:transcription factor bHLH94-like [Telopea speciosissima]|uniref:transcription factor bHLH94-like n=1 Tax=Telopea speciosissima TaxID=54955 RepID=UPI001CC70F69|nr:transcription factor bHLH94-like [Telopea speciosissima]XP_043714157.1 transcription factor bHLH94-like [Telopea speciosissima]